MCKSQILLLGMSQASLDTPLRWRCQGPSWRLPPSGTEPVDAGLGNGWKGLAQPSACFPSHSEPSAAITLSGRHWRLESTAKKLSLAQLHRVSFLPLHPTGTSWLSMGRSNPEQAPSHFQKV